MNHFRTALQLLQWLPPHRHFRSVFAGTATLVSLASPLSAEVTGLELVEEYCFDCHGDGLKKGELSLDKLLEEPDDHTHDWTEVWKMTRHELMPPADEFQPTDEERERITRWIEAERLGVDHDKPDPGRVTMRRLNRMEYEFTITDLFGTEILTEETFSSDAGVAATRLRDRLPPDDTAFGFDNIGAFQNLSPALLEKYFNIADLIVDQVIAFDGPSFPRERLDSGAIEIVHPPDTHQAQHTIDFTAPSDGSYTVSLQFTLGGWIDYDGAYALSLQLDDQSLVTQFIEVGGQETHSIAPIADLKAGNHRLTFVTDARKPDSRGRLKHLDLRPRIEVEGPMNEGTAAFPESHRRIFFRGEAPADPDARRDYAREILRRIADRAFRRPATEDDLDRLTAIALRQDRFERGIGVALTAILASPRFLFRAELQPQPNDPKSIHPIDEFALASRLSYFLWLSLPDERLTALAKQGNLRDNLHAQVHRMLNDPKAARFFEDFPGQWLRTRNILMTPISRRDGEIGPFRGALKYETERFFEHIVREDLDLVELITADYSFINDHLANYYGISNIEGGHFRKVTFNPEDHRGGLLTQGSFLASTSNPNRTSPVKRGLFVLENLLAIEPPPPPPNTPPLEEPSRRDENPRTVREQLVLHREDKSCASCHAHFDPIGLVLENYDVIGRWRDEEYGQAIKPHEITTTGVTLEGIDDLKGYFATRKDRFYRCATEKLMTYALGRGLEPADAVTIDAITTRLMTEGGRFSTLLTAVIDSPAFQTRRGDDGRINEPQRNIVPAIPPPDKRKGRHFDADVFPKIQKQNLEQANPE